MQVSGKFQFDLELFPNSFIIYHYQCGIKIILELNPIYSGVDWPCPVVVVVQKGFLCLPASMIQ